MPVMHGLHSLALSVVDERATRKRAVLTRA
jgi:hypothetical protein